MTHADDDAHRDNEADRLSADVVLIGTGIMSATLGSLLAVLEPDWRIVMIERADAIATESSAGHNNAGTGHMGLCELNYMPDPEDGSRPAEVAAQFHASRQWWAHLVGQGVLDPGSFIRPTPHLDLVFGERDVEYLRRRASTLRADPLFTEMEYTEDPEQIRRWAPLVMDGRAIASPMAATRHRRGTDIDFGALTSALCAVVERSGGRIVLGCEVRAIGREGSGDRVVSGRLRNGRRLDVHARRHVFVGAGGQTLRLLQKARLPEARGLAVLPVGAAFLRTSAPTIVERHTGKVYGQAPLGAPPMSVPHLDRRHLGDETSVMFGPFATFSTKLLRHGALTDLFKTVRLHNISTIISTLWHNRPLIRYLIAELLISRRRRLDRLREFVPTARHQDWRLHHAGQRAQLVTPAEHGATLHHGTELLLAQDRSISGLLGASPGASTAVSIMLDLLQRAFPHEWNALWRSQLLDSVPAHGRTGWSTAEVTHMFSVTDRALGLTDDEGSD